MSTASDEKPNSDEARRASDERFRRYFELGLVGVAMTSPVKGILEINDELCRILGYDRSELLQKTWSELTHPDDLAADIAQFNRVMAGEIDDYTMDKRWIRKDGTVIHTIMAARCARGADGSVDYFVGLVQDITERKRAEEALRKTNEKYEMILESITDKFFAVDREWRYTHFNRHAEEQLRVLGKNPSSLIGSTLWEEFPDPPQEKELRRAMSERTAITHEHYYAPLGEWVENRIYPSPDGGLALFVSYVTERKRAEESLHAAQAELAHFARVTLMGELTASIAHEMNQPLAAIVTNGNAALRWLAGAKPNLDEARDAVQRIVRDGTRAGEIIQRIRTLMSKTAPHKEALDLNETIRDVAGLLRGELRRNEVALKMELSDGLAPALGDRVQLQQVQLNLIMNAIEAMSAVAGRPRELIIQTQNAADDRLCVMVRDSGTGLENLQRIFEPFYTTKWRGMGMGLSISRSIIEAHGGRLWAAPNDGPGATFYFTLPVGARGR